VLWAELAGPVLLLDGIRREAEVVDNGGLVDQLAGGEVAADEVLEVEVLGVEGFVVVASCSPPPIEWSTGQMARHMPETRRARWRPTLAAANGVDVAVEPQQPVDARPLTGPPLAAKCRRSAHCTQLASPIGAEVPSSGGIWRVPVRTERRPGPTARATGRR
jgi:hypothetical protein